MEAGAPTPNLLLTVKPFDLSPHHRFVGKGETISEADHLPDKFTIFRGSNFIGAIAQRRGLKARSGAPVSGGQGIKPFEALALDFDKGGHLDGKTKFALAHDRPASSSFRSIAATGTRNKRPTLIVGMSPLAVASYEAPRLRP
jgi:hypothetical protein